MQYALRATGGYDNGYLGFTRNDYVKMAISRQLNRFNKLELESRKVDWRIGTYRKLGSNVQRCINKNNAVLDGFDASREIISSNPNAVGFTGGDKKVAENINIRPTTLAKRASTNTNFGLSGLKKDGVVLSNVMSGGTLATISYKDSAGISQDLNILADKDYAQCTTEDLIEQVNKQTSTTGVTARYSVALKRVVLEAVDYDKDFTFRLSGKGLIQGKATKFAGTITLSGVNVPLANVKVVGNEVEVDGAKFSVFQATGNGVTFRGVDNYGGVVAKVKEAVDIYNAVFKETSKLITAERNPNAVLPTVEEESSLKRKDLKYKVAEVRKGLFHRDRDLVGFHSDIKNLFAEFSCNNPGVAKSIYDTGLGLSIKTEGGRVSEIVLDENKLKAALASGIGVGALAVNKDTVKEMLVGQSPGKEGLFTKLGKALESSSRVLDSNKSNLTYKTFEYQDRLKIEQARVQAAEDRARDRYNRLSIQIEKHDNQLMRLNQMFEMQMLSMNGNH